ncbi:hypothetical protein D3C73_1027850 [compost metagenome]
MRAGRFNFLTGDHALGGEVAVALVGLPGGLGLRRRRVRIGPEGGGFPADEAGEGLADPHGLARRHEDAFHAPPDGGGDSRASIHHGLDTPRKAGFRTPSPADADNDETRGLGLRGAEGDEALRRRGLAFDRAPFIGRTGFPAGGGGRVGPPHGKIESAAPEHHERRYAADQQRLVGYALAHYWAPWKGARPSWRARSISARTRARRASTAVVLALTRAARATRISSWEMRPASNPIRDSR